MKKTYPASNKQFLWSSFLFLPATMVAIFTVLLFFSSCIDQSVSKRGLAFVNSKYAQSQSSQISPSDSHENNESSGPQVAMQTIDPQIELRYFVDPIQKSYQEKITIPKNYNGYLYIAGLNITSLSDRLVKVRFKFGRELEAVTIPATIARASGITPQTDIQVLIMDLRNRDFEKIRLLYDLYDYNDYTYSGSDSPVTDPYDPNLYCRGLNLIYDPTYDDNECNTNEKKCLWAFARIKDSGPYGTKSGTPIAVLPSEPQVDISGIDFTYLPTPENSTETLTERNQDRMEKCLPDNGVIYYKSYPFGNGDWREMHFGRYDQASIQLANYNTILASILDPKDGQQVDYLFKGPYRPISVSSWALPATKAIGKYGIFARTIDGSNDINRGIFSYLFPRAGKMELEKNIKYLGSDYAFISNVPTPYSTPIGTPSTASPRSIEHLLSAGTTKWMDGCNFRVSNYDKYTNESISSCNVTATIELITINKTTGKEEEIPISNKSEIKLQITKSSLKNINNEETLYQSMKDCTSARTCAANECCFNHRCWSKNLVARCPDDTSEDGNREVGDMCTTDYQCASLCCNRSIGRCAVHNGQLNPAVLCSKSPGDYCVAKEWCQQENVKDCRIIRTGTSASGSVICALQCYNRLEHGKCIDGICIAPSNPAMPSFDPDNPDCSQAQDPPLTL